MRGQMATRWINAFRIKADLDARSLRLLSILRSIQWLSVMIHDELRVVQLLHPGGEHRPDANGFKEWNRQSQAHKRIFLEQSGRAIAGLDATREFQGDLHFWAEWEPESELVCQFGPTFTDGPRFLFRPFLRQRSNYSGLQNTDPFVFGDRFYYCICQQRGAMQRLERGSIILFGSNRLGRFVLDTVFVVAGWKQHSSADFRRLLVPSAYRQAALEPLYDTGHCSDPQTTIPSNESHRLYEGATLNDPVDEMFSFFPCLPATESSNGFACPNVFLPDVINPTLMQGRKTTVFCDARAVRSVWHSVVQQVTRANLWLGFSAKLPRVAGPPGSFVAQRLLAADEADELDAGADACSSPGLARLYAHAAKSLDSAVQIAFASRASEPIAVAQFVGHCARLDEHLSRASLLCKNQDVLSCWPTNPGIMFSWKVGASALEVSLIFSGMIQTAAKYGRLGAFGGVNIDPLPVNPTCDERFVKWRDATIEELQLRTLPQLPAWPTWEIHRDHQSLQHKLGAEYKQSLESAQIARTQTPSDATSDNRTTPSEPGQPPLDLSATKLQILRAVLALDAISEVKKVAARRIQEQLRKFDASRLRSELGDLRALGLLGGPKGARGYWLSATGIEAVRSRS